MNWKGGISWTPQDAVAARKIALMTLYISHRAVAWKTPLQEASIVCPVASLNVLFASGVYEKGQARRKNRGFLGRLGFRGGCPHRGHSFADSCRVISNWTPKGETYRSHCAICKWCIREKIKQGARIEDSWIDCHHQSQHGFSRVTRCLMPRKRPCIETRHDMDEVRTFIQKPADISVCASSLWCIGTAKQTE